MQNVIRQSEDSLKIRRLPAIVAHPRKIVFNCFKSLLKKRLKEICGLYWGKASIRYSGLVNWLVEIVSAKGANVGSFGLEKIYGRRKRCVGIVNKEP